MPFCTERRYERDQHDQSGIDHESRDFGDATDIFDPILLGEAEILVEPVARVVAVKEVGAAAQRMQLLLDQVRDRALAGARIAGQPHHARSLPLQRRTRLLVDVERLPVNILRSAQREVQRTGGQRVMRDAIDQNEAAEIAATGVWLECDRAVELELADANLVELEAFGRQVLPGVDIELVLE